jgi:hypothetical protein
MQKEEIPAVLLRYLECLAVPIIPEDALRDWPSTITEEYLSGIGSELSCLVTSLEELLTLEHCLAILNLRIGRGDLLIYLLLCIAAYDTTCTYWTRGPFLNTYGPYICGRNHRSNHDQVILRYLIKSVRRIIYCINETFQEDKEPSFDMVEQYEGARARLKKLIELKRQQVVIEDREWKERRNRKRIPSAAKEEESL